MKNQQRIKLLIVLLIAVVMAAPALAQSSAPEITIDDVNAIAKNLYCPICENIPLDTCGAPACEDWRYEIRLQLEAGYTQAEIIEDFVARFGQRVVGTPHDPFLRALSLATPWVLVLLAGFGIFYSFVRVRQPESNASNTPEPTPQDTYRKLLEQDLSS